MDVGKRSFGKNTLLFGYCVANPQSESKQPLLNVTSLRMIKRHDRYMTHFWLRTTRLEESGTAVHKTTFALASKSGRNDVRDFWRAADIPVDTFL